MREDTRIEVVQSLARAPGLLVLVALIVAGLGITSVYFHWKAPEVADRIRTARAAVSSDPAERLDIWLEVGEPQIHNRLNLLRMSAQQPWLVTHVVEDGHEEGPAIFGLDLSTRSCDVRREGLVVLVLLPAPRLLGRGALRGDNAGRVPRYRGEAHSLDPSGRLSELVEWALRNPGDMIGALEKDIPGASLSIRVEEQS